MTRSRITNILLKILRDYFKESHSKGNTKYDLTQCVLQMYREGLITEKEKHNLRRYMNKNAPQFVFDKAATAHADKLKEKIRQRSKPIDFIWWGKSETRRPLAWLDDHIKLTKPHGYRGLMPNWRTQQKLKNK